MLIYNESDAVYHGQRKEFITSHGIIDFLKCPMEYNKHITSESADAEKNNAFNDGTATHLYILEGKKKYDKSVIVGGPVNPASGKPFGGDTKAFKEWADLQLQKSKNKNALFLSEEKHQMVQSMATSVFSHRLASNLLKNGKPEVVVRLTDFNGSGLKAQAKIDWLQNTGGIVDLKTCSDIDRFPYDAKMFGYTTQMAFYRLMLAQELECDPTTIPTSIIVVSKMSPYLCAVWTIKHERLAEEEVRILEAIERMKECEDTGIWPTGYEEERTLE